MDLAISIHCFQASTASKSSQKGKILPHRKSRLSAKSKILQVDKDQPHLQSSMPKAVEPLPSEVQDVGNKNTPVFFK